MKIEDIDFRSRKWEEMDNDVFVKIFQCFDIFGLTSGIGHITLSLSHGNITTLIFHYNLFVSNDQLTYTSESIEYFLLVDHKNTLTLQVPKSEASSYACIEQNKEDWNM
ncbi:unnamed protein product [Fraxinus pennsylvanica]|uniref:Uncharacterized protein n=1 Tax=Fraxinus pennsylvanica TaxID=56036 RepID=A0AAD1ZFV8_9LAMI|nr:unnamed protein product [Fraxinus pennsylvanica]